jgi:hypothetical protein
MTYTKSKDGEMRQGTSVHFRLTREKLNDGNARARAHGYRDLHDWLLHCLLDDLLYIEERLPLDNEGID